MLKQVEIDSRKINEEQTRIKRVNIERNINESRKIITNSQNESRREDGKSKL